MIKDLITQIPQPISEEELLARIAWFYYHDNLTQGEIGDKLGLLV